MNALSAIAEIRLGQVATTLGFALVWFAALGLTAFMIFAAWTFRIPFSGEFWGFVSTVCSLAASAVAIVVVFIASIILWVEFENRI